MKILQLIDSLGYHGNARQLQLLAPALVSQGAAVEVCCLGPETPWSASVRRAAIPVHALGWTRWLDVNVFLRLREIVRASSADVIHVWGLPSLRALAAVARDLLPRVLMNHLPDCTARVAWWDRALLGRVRCVNVAPGVIPQEKGPDSFSGGIACIGALERENGFRFGIWAFDFLRFLYPDARLRFVGAGSELPTLRTLAIGLQSDAAIEFLGAQPEVADVVRDADVVWIPSQANTGRQVALEAMAAGRPVIASDVPCLREVIQDGVTGFLVPVGDVLHLARCTKSLFDAPSLRQRLGAAAREFAQKHHSLANIASRWRDHYQRVAA